MRAGEPDPQQVVQRVRVGLIGLAAVILLIGVAGMIFSALRRDGTAAPTDPANAQVAAAVGNAADAADPLADLGVAPGAADPVVQNAR